MNRGEILKKPVAVLGGGACGQTFAAEFTLAGYKVRLYELPEFASESLGDVLKTHEIELGGKQLNFKWFKRTGSSTRRRPRFCRASLFHRGYTRGCGRAVPSGQKIWCRGPHHRVPDTVGVGCLSAGFFQRRNLSETIGH